MLTDVTSYHIITYDKILHSIILNKYRQTVTTNGLFKPSYLSGHITINVMINPKLKTGWRNIKAMT